MRWSLNTMAIGFAVLAASALVSADDKPLRAVIDDQVRAVWEKEKLTPARPATDAEFLRRVYLDLCGSVPTYDETVSFLADATADKRATLIDRLLDDPRFAQHQADIWDMILFGRNPPGFDTDKREGIQRWLREQFAKNTPYDALALAILRAEGNTLDDGPPMFYVQYRNQPEDVNEAISQIFLGVQLQCARCHDHPYETWKQTDFFGMAAFLARLEVVTVGKANNLTKYAIGEKNSGDILFTGPAKDQSPGKKGEPLKPKFLLGAALDEPPLPKDFKEVKFEANKPPPPPKFSRKDQLAAWITQPDNPYFARAIANRVWAQFLGRGLVHPVDNMSPANQPSHPDLLAALATALRDHRFDLRWYIRELVNSQTYQLSSIGGSGEQNPQLYIAARTRPLSAEELVEAWRITTGYAAVETTSPPKGVATGRFRPLESGYMLRFFGQPNSGTGDFQGGLQEHLYLNNGPLRNLLTTAKGSLLATVSDTSLPIDARVERLYLALLHRPPRDVERQRMSEYVSVASAKSDERWAEAMWVLMTCSEFRFNH
ncbi:MAG: DUF1549 domain-containing protein [Planctomycetaceae bacterium]|nr:DUF1549 domain-containing protein [Planctomycetaceae bacterium]